jgi:UDP:flavonoid glycosyltransferase YjiC (YdhE family)
LQRRLANLVPRLLTGPVASLNALADELGVERIPNLVALMCGELTLVTEDPAMLGMTAADFESWRPRWPSRPRSGTTFRATGPLFAHLDIPVPERVEAFLSGNPRVVYLSPTSVREDFLRDLVREVRAAGSPVLVAGTVHDLSDMEDDATMVAGTLPNHVVMPRAAACVVMGGQGSVQCAMASGTPMVALPYHGEQELNVAVAVRNGMCVAVSPHEVPGGAVTSAVRRVLTDPTFARAGARVRSIYAGTDGASAAAEAILRHLDREGAEAANR